MSFIPRVEPRSKALDARARLSSRLQITWIDEGGEEGGGGGREDEIRIDHARVTLPDGAALVRRRRCAFALLTR